VSPPRRRIDATWCTIRTSPFPSPFVVGVSNSDAAVASDFGRAPSHRLAGEPLLLPHPSFLPRVKELHLGPLFGVRQLVGRTATTEGHSAAPPPPHPHIARLHHRKAVVVGFQSRGVGRRVRGEALVIFPPLR
jgi:hypothetical protein